MRPVLRFRAPPTEGQRGQGLVEYALIIVLVAIVVIVALTLLGPAIADMFDGITRNLESPGVSPAPSPEPRPCPVPTEIGPYETACPN